MFTWKLLTLLPGCTVPLEDTAEPVEDEEDLFPWPSTPPDPDEDPDCTGAVLSVWLDDPEAVEEVMFSVVLLGGQTTYSVPPAKVTWSSIEGECGYPDVETALQDLPLFQMALLVADPLFADYPFDLIDDCPCIAR